MRSKKQMKGMWRRTLAFAIATVLAFGGMNLGGVSPLVVRAAETNLVANGDFQANWDASDWNKVNADEYPVKQNNDYNNSTQYFNYYNDNAQDFSISKDVTVAETGTYTATVEIAGNAADDSGLFFTVGTKNVALTGISGSGWQTFTIEDISLEADATVSVSVAGSVAEGYWFVLDNITLTKNASEDEAKTAALAALTQLIADCEVLTASDYNATKWSELQTALTAAKEISDTNTTEEITSATNALQTAKNNLWSANVVYLADMESGIPNDWNISWSVGEATSAQDSGNGGSVWNVYSEAAQTFTASKTLSGMAAGNYRVTFETAGDWDTVTGNISISDGTTPKSADMVIWAWNNYQSATTGYVSVAEGGSATITVYADIPAKGYFKMDNIKVEKVSDEEILAEKNTKLSELNNLITECNTIDSSVYTTESYANLTAQITTAQSFYNSASAAPVNVSMDDITAAITALQAAKDALVRSVVEYVEGYEETFDDRTMNDWDTTWTGTADTFKGKESAGVDGTPAWEIWSNAGATGKSTLSLNLKAGNYTVSVQTIGTAAQASGSIFMYETGDISNKISTPLVFESWNAYTKTTAKYLTLTEDAAVTVELDMVLPAGGCFTMDNIVVTKISDEDMEEAILAEKQAAMTALNTLITDCNSLVEDEWTADSYAALLTQLTTASDFYNTANADLSATTVDAINAVIADLQAAEDALVSATTVSAEIFVDKLNLDDDFIKGVDVSSYIAEVDSGVVYYDFDGNAVEGVEFFNLLADSGVNWVRIRVWNDPYDSNGNGYGGGNNDIAKAKEIGALATDAGLKVLIDFHYSDFWADPASQDAPKAWQSLTTEERVQKVYDYTLESLNALHAADVDVRMVQIGNETNNGICGETDWANRAKIYNAGSSAVRAYEDAVFGEGVEDGSEVQVAVHFTEPHTGVQAGFAADLKNNNVDYDVFATSYYPFWHGTLDNLSSVLSSISETYEVDVMVAETSYAYTFEDGDGHENNVRAGNATTLDLDYNISIQGQADALSDIMKTINDVDGLGMFYWEPAWIPVQVYDPEASNAAEVLASNKVKWDKYGSGWAASYSASWDPEDAGLYYGGSSWDNQALFDHNGHPLDSLNVFKYVDTGATTDVRLDGIASSSVDVILGNEIILPATVTGIKNDGSEVTLDVVWDEELIANISEIGIYTVTGVAGGLEAICTVEILPINLLVNGDFESGIVAGNGWTINVDEAYADKVKDDTENEKRGEKAIKFDGWSDFLTDVTVTQTVNNLPAGVYSCYMHVQGAGEKGKYDIAITANVGDTVVGTANAELLGWSVWNMAQVNDIEVEEGGSVTVTISFSNTAAEIWATVDEVYLYRVGDVSADDEGSDDTTPDDDESDNPTSGVPGDDSSSDDSSDSNEDTMIDWNEVQTDVQTSATGSANGTQSVNLNYTCTGETKVPSSVLKEIKNEKVTLAFHSGNGVALSISGQKLKGVDVAKLQNIDLTVTHEPNVIPDAAVNSKAAVAKRELSIRDTGSFGLSVDMHINVGKEHAGKVANLYRYNHNSGRLEFCSHFVITAEGQSMFAIARGGDYLITVTNTTINETVWYFGGGYTVQAGDNLSAIAVRYHMPMAELIRRNPQLTNLDLIKPGQKINVN